MQREQETALVHMDEVDADEDNWEGLQKLADEKLRTFEMDHESKAGSELTGSWEKFRQAQFTKLTTENGMTKQDANEQLDLLHQNAPLYVAQVVSTMHGAALFACMNLMANTSPVHANQFLNHGGGVRLERVGAGNNVGTRRVGGRVDTSDALRRLAFENRMRACLLMVAATMLPLLSSRKRRFSI